jgi:hypothetical protein
MNPAALCIPPPECRLQVKHFKSSSLFRNVMVASALGKGRFVSYCRALIVSRLIKSTWHAARLALLTWRARCTTSNGPIIRTTNKTKFPRPLVIYSLACKAGTPCNPVFFGHQMLQACPPRLGFFEGRPRICAPQVLNGFKKNIFLFL